MGQGTTREIVISTDEAEKYSVGEVVNVMARQSAGVMAVVLCYVVPLIVLVTALAVAVALGVTEGLSAMLSLGVTALYYALLGLFHKRISKRVIFTINKI